MSKFLSVILASVLAARFVHAAGVEMETSRPRLVVLIAVDQMRGDYLTRYADHFGEGGFRRLMRDGAHFVNAYYSYSSSVTAAGHATLGSGRIPRLHGIVGNEWTMGSPPAKRASVYDPDSPIVGPGAVSTNDAATSARAREGGKSPRNLVGTSFGDQLKLADRRSRVFSVALKDRAAIMMAGKKPDAAFWYETENGCFVTSRWYRDSLPVYAKDFDDSHWMNRYAGAVWDRIGPGDAYAGRHPLDPAWLGKNPLGPAFPHKLPGLEAPGGALYSRLYDTPFGNEVVLEMARRLIASEKLGGGPATDMLCLGFSSNDPIGHAFGPESEEVMDVTLRTDRQIADLLATLDEQVGLGQCLVALSADHGVSSAARVLNQAGTLQEIADTKAMAKALDQSLVGEFGPASEGKAYVQGIGLPWVGMGPGFANLPRVRRSAILSAATAFLKAQSPIAEAVSSDELVGPAPSRDDLGRWLAWRSYFPGRSGDIFLRLRPDARESLGGGMAGHGYGFNHDRHVPILLMGGGVEPGRHYTPADPADIAPTLAAVLGIEAPTEAVGRVLSEALDRTALAGRP